MKKWLLFYKFWYCENCKNIGKNAGNNNNNNITILGIVVSILLTV